MASKRNRGGDLAGMEVNKEFGYYVPRKYWASRLAPYVGEWAAVGGVWVAGEGVHLWMASATALPWVSTAETLLGTGLTALTWTCAKARSAFTRRHATATTGVTAAWLTAATITGATATPVWQVWALGGATVALSWNIRRLLRNSSEDGGADGLFEKVKLAGVKAREIEVGPNKLTAPLQLTSPETSIADVQAQADTMGRLLHLHKGAVRVTEHPDDQAQGTLTIVPNDVLRHPQPWQGPSAPGGSIMAGLRVGLYEDNEPQLIYLPGDKRTHRNATHYIVQGMNGSGKSHGAKEAWTEILTRRDVCLIVLDPSKGEQTVSFLGKDNAHVITGAKECKQFVKKVPAAVTANASTLGQWGFDQWTPQAFEQYGMPYTVLWIEEAPRVLEDAATITRIVQEARSAGISVVLSLQKASFRQMSTDTRSQLGGVWCFGVNELEDAAYTLDEAVIDAGARPDRWKNRRPGCNYLVGPGIDEERFAVPGRTFGASDQQLAADIEAGKPYRAAMHPITANALGLPIRPGEVDGLPAATAAQAAAASTGGPTPPAPVDDDRDDWEDDDMDLEALADEIDDDEVDDLAPLPAEHEPELVVDADAELPVDDLDMALPGGRPTPAEARQMLAEMVAALAATGRTTFTVRDLPDPEQTFGRGRSWLSGQLGQLVVDGTLTEAGTDGKATVYAFRMRDAA
ncbi:hypothetical protein [Kutzneria chonburiensis]|uniref:Uncharacterized protein n=1 Tax=Kutzneria chonburiensis TaxID=1483604 RepID=A0ABV6MLB9_9PSEU|nr:hypothetical protein [Kutzneria chonburiensis]